MTRRTLFLSAVALILSFAVGNVYMLGIMSDYINRTVDQRVAKRLVLTDAKTKITYSCYADRRMK